MLVDVIDGEQRTDDGVVQAGSDLLRRSEMELSASAAPPVDGRPANLGSPALDEGETAVN